MVSADVTQSPLESVWRQIIPQGHDQALRNAFYNVAAAVFVGGAAAAAWSVYLILEPFVQPLMWAVLFGSVLHPVKHRVAATVRKWLFDVKEAKTLLSVSVALLPVTSLDNLSEIVGWYVMEHMRAVVTVTIVLPVMYVVIHYTPSALSQLAYSIITLLYSMISIVLDMISYVHILVLLLILAYVGMVIFYWNPDNQTMLRRLSLPAWLLGAAALSCIWPSASVPLFFLFCLLLLGGLYTEALELHKKLNEGAESSIITSIIAVSLGSSDELLSKQASQLKLEEIENLKATDDANPSDLQQGDEATFDNTTEKDPTKKDNIETVGALKVSRPKKFPPAKASSAGQSKDDNKGSSNVYLKGVFVACVLVQLWRHSYLIPLLPIAMLYYGLKKATSYHLFGGEGIRSKTTSFFETANTNLDSWMDDRKQVFLPLPIRGLFKLLKRTDHKVVSVLSSSTDAVVTLLVILGVLFFLMLASIFLAVQIQGEGMQLVLMGSQLINATVVNNPQFHEMLPEGLSDVLGSTVENAYVYGREWISGMVRGMLGETNDEKAAVLEKQVVELWDHIYQAWVAAHPQTPYMGPVVTSEAVATTFDSLIDGLRKTPGLISFSTVSDVMRDNIGTVMSVLDSIWAILLSNLSLAVSALTAASSLLLGGSLSILNALLNLIVFLSALFYILSISNDVYKPVAILTDLAPGQMNRVGGAVEDSINGVFKASFKMGAFYGMWTWLLHSVFATNIVYIPAVLGAVFGAVPLVGTYWAAIPGAIELFWGHGSPIMALLLIIAQLLPLSCVDTAIYSEIKGGGHPYLTGLAVAGGIFCWGVEGAILGPLVLCILLVVTKTYTSFIQLPEEIVKFRQFRRCQSELRIS